LVWKSGKNVVASENIMYNFISGLVGDRRANALMA